jgi:hypothetical protein
MPNVYLETTIVSYLTARPRRNLVVAAHLALTAERWNSRRQQFSLFVSRLVLDEAGAGDPEMAARRLAELGDFPILPLNEEAMELAQSFLDSGLMPEKAIDDALHVAVATLHRMDYLLTWNCRHIANAEILRGLTGLCGRAGFELPALCTPEQLMGD